MVYHPSRTYLPKEAWAGAVNRSFPSPHHQTTPPFTSYLWPMAPPCPILAGYRLVAPGSCACFPFNFVQESACCSCICRDLETLRLHFLAFHAGFLLVLCSNQKLGLVWWWALYFFGPPLVFSLLPAALACNSCRNDPILLGPFLGWLFYSFSQWPIIGTILFLFTHGLLCPFVFSFWASAARLLILLGFLGLFANSTLPWALLLTSLGFPGPITLSLSLSFMSLP